MESYPKEKLESFISETFRNVSEYNPIHTLNISYKNTRTNPSILNRYTEHLKQKKTMGSLVESILQTIEDFSSLNLYKFVNVKLQPGDSLDCADIVFDFKEKSKFFASFSHYIETRSSEATLNCKFGLRNLLGLAENYTLEYEKAINRSHKSTFDFTIDFPFIYKDYSLQTGHIEGNKLLTTNVEEMFDMNFFKFFLNKEKNKSISLENKLRTNHISPKDACIDFLENEIIPSKKKSIKYWWNSTNNLRESNGKTKGDYTDHTFELAFGDTWFLKYEFLQRNFFHVHRLKKILPKRLFKKLNFENNFQLSIVKSLNNEPIRLNDRFEMINARGFYEIGPKMGPQNLFQHPNVGKEGYEPIGDLIGSDFIMKNSLKINVHNYPFLKNGNIIPFFHFSTFFLFNKALYGAEGFREKVETIMDCTRMSFGMGISANVGMGAKIELLYNFLHVKKKTDVPNNFQIRLTLND